MGVSRGGGSVERGPFTLGEGFEGDIEGSEGVSEVSEEACRD